MVNRAGDHGKLSAEFAGCVRVLLLGHTNTAAWRSGPFERSLRGVTPTPERPIFATARLGFVVLLSMGCRPVASGVDPEQLGYGPGPHADLASRYDEDPVPRPAPTAWTPPERQPIPVQPPPELGSPAPVEPVPHVADVVRVCEHLAGFGGGSEPKSERDACLRRYRVARLFRTIGSWKTLVACIESAGDPAAVTACEAMTPPVFSPGEDYPRETGACLHLFALLIVEEMGAEPMFEREDILDFEPLVRECVDALVTETRKKRSPSEYAEMLTCVAQAETSAVAEACEAEP